LVEIHREGEENSELADILRIPLQHSDTGKIGTHEQVETMLTAHKQLTKVDASNVARFSDVIAFLEQDLQQLEAE
jgi:hypothetical protein